MKALTVCQPWAWAILAKIKQVENRNWFTPYRGPLLIHAGKSLEYMKIIPDLAGDIQYKFGLTIPDKLEFGAILGSVELVDCLPLGRLAAKYGNLAFAEGPAYWVLKKARLLLAPIVYRGGMGLFDIPDEVLAGAAWERQCRVCGCTQDDGCPLGCCWTEEDLCSACSDRE